MRSRLRQLVIAVWCVLVLGLIPGAVVRGLVFERVAPPLPPSPDRDAKLDITVVDAATDAPVARARVQALAMVDERAHFAGSAETDSAGHARLEGLPHDEVWLLATAAGYARASSQLVLTERARSVRLELTVEHRLNVSVKDELGAAIVDAEVEVVAADPLPVGARTGSDGVAEVARLSEPPWIVTARATGFEQVSRRGVRDGESVSITLRKLGAIAVTVLGSDDAPASGAHVQIAGTSLWPARVAETKGDGRVRIGALAAGAYALRAWRGEQASPIEVGVALDRGEQRDVTLRLGPGRMVLVRVTDGDASDAPPLSGARVSVVEGGVSPFPLEASTDRDGRARLGPIAPGSAFVSARADGFVPRGGIEAPDGGQVVAIALVRAGTLTGRVVDARGFPVDGASIEIVGTDPLGAPIDDDPRRTRFREAHFDATLSGPRPLIPSGELGVVPGPVPPIPHAFDLPAVHTGATSDEPWITRDDGTFRASPATPGRVRALVRHPQYVEALSEIVTLAAGGEAHVDVVMHAGGSLEGRVLDAGGRPVGGARVMVAAARGSLERVTRTATDGTFAFASLPGQVSVSASLDDEGALTGRPTDTSPAFSAFESVATRISVDIPEGGLRVVTLTLPEPRAPLPVRVRDDRGYPIETAQLTATSLDPASPVHSIAFTDGRGEAGLSGVRGLALRVEARAPRHASAVVTAEPSAESLEITLGPAEGATGEVRGARGGEAIADAEVVLYTDLGARRTRTEPSGAFTLEDLPLGVAHLRVRAPGYAMVTRDQTLALTSRHTTDLGRIELPVEGVVTGTVVDARGDPVPRARVAKDRVPTFLAVGATPAGISVADERGRFRLGELSEGTIALEAYAPDVGRARADGIKVSSGRSTDGVRITLRSSADEHGSEPAAAGSVAVTLGETGGEPREVVLVAVAESSEAERAGLAPGDTVVEVDGASVHTMAEARARLSGPLADDVLVKLRRGERTFSLRVAREPVRR